MTGLVLCDEKVSGLVVLTAYAKDDAAVAGRFLQAVTLRRFRVERFIVDFSGFDHRSIKGLENVKGALLRMTIVMSVPDHSDVERISKLLNRIVDVYKVEHTFRI